MVVVDTSVLVPILRSAPMAEWARFWELVDADLVTVPVVRQELRAGLSRRQMGRVTDLLGGLPSVVPMDETWTTIADFTDRAAAAGQRFGLADLLIAAMTRELGAVLWTFDRDFDRMHKLGFVQLLD
jgi:predicted nucleic acid-binding protein